MTRVPPVEVEHVLDHPLCRDVSEVEPWRQARGGLQVGVVTVFVVPFKSSIQEFSPALVGRHAASFHVGHRGDVVVDVKRFQRFTANPISLRRPPDELQRCLRSVRFLERQIDEVFIDVRQPDGWSQWEFDGHVCKVVLDGFVEVPSKGVRRGEGAPSVAHRDEPVPVDHVHFARRQVQGALSDLSRHVGGVVVDDKCIGVNAHAGKQSARLAVAGFDVRHVTDTAAKEVGALVDHALQDEGVDSIVGPTVANGQGFHDQERKVAFHREVHGVLQGKVVTGAPGRGHPIQHVCALVPVFRRTYGEPRALPIHTCGSAHRSQWSFGGISRTVQGPAVSNDGSYTDALPFNHGHEH